MGINLGSDGDGQGLRAGIQHTEFPWGRRNGPCCVQELEEAVIREGAV